MTDDWPVNLGEGKLPGHRENVVDYVRGLALRRLGREDEAKKAFGRAASGGETVSGGQMFYNDQPPEMQFYQGLARRALGNEAGAVASFQGLVQFADAHSGDVPEVDFFAVSLPEFLVFEADLAASNKCLCRFLKGLGLAGLGRREEAKGELKAVLSDYDAAHLGAAVHLAQLAE